MSPALTNGTMPYLMYSDAHILRLFWLGGWVRQVFNLTGPVKESKKKAETDCGNYMIYKEEKKLPLLMLIKSGCHVRNYS